MYFLAGLISFLFAYASPALGSDIDAWLGQNLGTQAAALIGSFEWTTGSAEAGPLGGTRIALQGSTGQLLIQFDFGWAENIRGKRIEAATNVRSEVPTVAAKALYGAYLNSQQLRPVSQDAALLTELFLAATLRMQVPVALRRERIMVMPQHSPTGEALHFFFPTDGEMLPPSKIETATIDIDARPGTFALFLYVDKGSMYSKVASGLKCGVKAPLTGSSGTLFGFNLAHGEIHTVSPFGTLATLDEVRELHEKNSPPDLLPFLAALTQALASEGGVQAIPIYSSPDRSHRLAASFEEWARGGNSHGGSCSSSFLR